MQRKLECIEEEKKKKKNTKPQKTYTVTGRYLHF